MAWKDPEAGRAYNREYGKAYRLANKEKIRAKNAAYLAKDGEKIRAKQRAKYTKNKAVVNAKHKQYREANKERTREYWRAYTAAHKEKIRASARISRAKNKQHRADYQRAYMAAHPEASQQRNSRRRARVAAAPRNDLTPEQWRTIQEAQDHRCAYCGKRFKWRLTQDHITPFSAGGSNTLHNVIGACGSCNSRKHTGPPPCPVQPLLI